MTCSANHALGGDIDLLSIDVDSIDYWIWDAVEGFRPRVVVCEYNSSFGPRRSVTVSRRDGFDPFALHPSGYYHGASLTALHKLATARGYQLIGCESAGANAFFVRRDCAGGLPDLDPIQVFVPHLFAVRGPGGAVPSHPTPPTDRGLGLEWMAGRRGAGGRRGCFSSSVPSADSHQRSG